MKKNLILSLIVLVAVCLGQKAKAQVTSTTGPINLTIDLRDAIFISLGTSPNVSFVYATGADYAASKTVNKVGQLKVLSSKPYGITVKAETEFSGTTAALGLLPLNLVSINVADPLGNTSIVLSDSPQAVVANAPATTEKFFNVDYTIADATSLIVLPKEIYTTTVTYTATQL